MSCSDTCPRAPRSLCCNYYSCPGPESPWQMISHVIILETRKTFPILLPALLPPSLCSSFLSLHLPNKPNNVHIRMQRNQPQGHLLPWPGAAPSLESSLSCSLTLSKKAQIAFPSTFLQTGLFDFLSLDQLPLPKSSPWAQGATGITAGGN